jgi:hypothetical protein
MSISIGTKIGAMIAHFADALPIAMLIIDATIMNAKISGYPVNPITCNVFAPVLERVRMIFYEL